VLEEKVIHDTLLTERAVKGGIHGGHSTRGIDNCLGITYSYSYTRDFREEGGKEIARGSKGWKL
jgi:hypothetical protein